MMLLNEFIISLLLIPIPFLTSFSPSITIVRHKLATRYSSTSSTSDPQPPSPSPTPLHSIPYNQLSLLVLPEPQSESRVSLTPVSASLLTSKGISVYIPEGVGLPSSYDDLSYTSVGCKIVPLDSVSDYITDPKIQLLTSVAGLHLGTLTSSLPDNSLSGKIIVTSNISEPSKVHLESIARLQPTIVELTR